MAGFLKALQGLPENPLARREWRGLQHQARDWRLWLGFRLPKDARGWGLPAILWFCIAPYVVWGALSIGHRVSPELFRYPPAPGIPYVDIVALCLVLLGVYTSLISIAVMAPAITRERERETWEAVRVSVSSPHEILLGLLAGRVGPILLAHFAAGLFWVLARPHYAPLLQPLSPITLDQPAIALLVWETGVAALAFGCMATAFSVYSRTTGLALVLSAAGFVFWFFLLIPAVVLAPAGGPVVILVGSALLGIASYLAAARGLERAGG